MKILAIESSCDETAAAVLEGAGVLSVDKNDDVKVDFASSYDLKLLSNVVVSQVDIFAGYGGVIPEVAARSHLEVILPVIDKTLRDAELTKDDIDAIAVTHTPGLLGSLLIGTLTARMLAILWRKPLFAVHHLKSHIYANWLTVDEAGDQSSLFSKPAAFRPVVTGETCFARSPLVAKSFEKEQSLVPASSHLANLPEFPLLALVVSGGHTQIIYMADHNQFEIIGTTRDDAVGECFDKVAKILGLPYPGGPAIARAAEQGDPKKYTLPHPKVDGLDFSFSGLKTAVLRAVQAELNLPITTPSFELADKLSEQQRADFAAVFQETAVEILLEKLQNALEGHPEARSVVIAGGVSANALLRKKAVERLSGASNAKYGAGEKSDEVQKSAKTLERGVKVYFPDLKFAGDNAAMVGVAAYFEILAGVKPTDPYALNIAPRTPIY